MINIVLDILSLAKLRCKMFLHSKSVIAAFLLSCVASVFVIATFLDSADEKSSLPIGVVDEDNTEKSQELVKQLKEDDVFAVTYGDYGTVMEELEEGTIYSMFVIESGFEERLINGKNSKLITDYYVKDRENVKILSDIVLSKILKDVCLVHSLKEYKTYNNDYDILTDGEYEEYINKQYGENGQLFAFDFEIVNIDTKENVTDNITNSIIYKQVIIAIIGILIAFVALFAANMIISDKRYGANIRLNISLINKVSIFVGDFLGLFFISGSFSLISGFFAVKNLGFSNTKHIMEFAAVCILYTIAIDLIFIILCRIIKEPITFQIAGAMIIFTLAIAGVFNVLSFLVPENVINITNKTPMAMFNKAFVNLIINGQANKQISGIFVNIVILFILGLIIQIVKGEDNRYEL